MLIQFTVGNFRSFKERQTLHMDVDTSYGLAEHMDTHTFACETSPKTKKITHLLKSKGIWGANASGKSNLNKALRYFIGIIHESVKDENVMKNIVQYRLSEETMGEPSYFEALFVANGVRYRYGFEATDKGILAEWLLGNPNGRETVFFKRDKQNLHSVSKTHFGEIEAAYYDYADPKKRRPKFRENSLILSTVSDYNGYVSQAITSYFDTYIFYYGLRSPDMLGIAALKLQNEAYKNMFVSFIRDLDVGIRDIQSESIEGEEGVSMRLNIETSHDVFSNGQHTGKITKFPYTDESEGTLKLFEMASPIIDALREGRVFVADEFDSRLHPNIIHQLVGLFNSEANSKNAQLIFVTHDTSLMKPTMMRRDQIDFVEKNERGESEIYSLSDITDVRVEHEYAKRYQIGSYGAVPQLGEFRDIGKLISSDKDQEEIDSIRPLIP